MGIRWGRHSLVFSGLVDYQHQPTRISRGYQTKARFGVENPKLTSFSGVMFSSVYYWNLRLFKIDLAITIRSSAPRKRLAVRLSS